MADTEEYFPRGGKKPTAGYFKQPGNFLGAANSDEKKRRKWKKTTEADDGYLSGELDREYQQAYKRCGTGLGVKTIRQGMLILGRVFRAEDTKLQISLPNKVRGVVMACHICEAYNKLLEAYVNDQVESVRALRTIFTPGQYVATKVLEVDPKPGASTMLSMMPQHVNANMQHGDLVKGTLIQAAVSSVEDHGYVMDLGIPNTRAFLPKDKTEEGIELEEGLVAWCVVTSSSITPGLCTVKLKANLESIQSAVCRKTNKLNALTPGTAVEFSVDKALETGIEGRIFDNITSYIQRNHTDAVKGKKPQLGQTIRARLLYTLPTNKIPFLTMKNVFESLVPDLEKEQRYKAGDIVENAKVIKIARGVVVMKLGKKNVGLMNVKGVVADEDLDDQQIIAKSYPLGSEHKVRILHYNMSDYHYSILDRTDVLEQKYFNLDDLSVGLTVEASITAVDDRRVTLQVDRVSGIVPISHVTDTGVYADPKKPACYKLPSRFKVGAKVQARVWSIDRENSTVFFTMKPTLLADAEILDKYDESALGKRFHGVIKVVKDFLMVEFFNRVIAFVPKMYVSKEPIENLADSYHAGQIIACTITNYYADTQQYRASLFTPPFDPSIPRTVRPDKRKNDKTNTETDQQAKKRRNNSDTSIDNSTKNDEDKISTKKRKKNSDSEADKDNIDGKETNSIQKNGLEPNSKKEAVLNKEHDASQFQVELERLSNFSTCKTLRKAQIRVDEISRALEKSEVNTTSIEEKINYFEGKGIKRNNKRYHGMQADLKVELERTMKLKELLQKAEEHLRTFTDESPVDNMKKKKNNNKQQNGDVATSKIVKDPEDIIKERVKQIKVADTSTTLELPSIKDFWTGEVMMKPPVRVVEELSSSEDEEKQQPKKKRKKLTAAEKVSKAREEEERLRSVELAALDGAPQSATQFERALLVEPDNSRLWLAYAALHLQSTEIEKARSVCRRALKTINFREEEEKFNIWIAMVNMEHRFGTEESQQKTLEEAIQMNDPYKVHTKLVDIFVDLNKTSDLSNLVDKMIRKYKRVADNYIQCGRACYLLKMVDKARQVMQKAVAVLDKKEHITVLVQFALLERAHGDKDRAEALFEQILGVYPQRVDVCSAYVDMLYKSGDYDQIRQVMERMTSHKLPARKMKVLYKKWIEVEEKIGDEAQVDRIRGKAMEFIDNAKF